MSLRIGVSLPVRELKDDLGAIRDFAELAEQLGFTHLCMRTLGGELDARGHLDALTRVHQILVEEGHLEDLE